MAKNPYRIKLVRENIDFKRGLYPKKSLDIGKHRKIYRPFNWKDIPSGKYVVVYDHKSRDSELDFRELTHIEWNGYTIEMFTDWYNKEDDVKKDFLLDTSYILSPEKFDDYAYTYIKKEE